MRFAIEVYDPNAKEFVRLPEVYSMRWIREKAWDELIEKYRIRIGDRCIDLIQLNRVQWDEKREEHNERVANSRFDQ